MSITDVTDDTVLRTFGDGTAVPSPTFPWGREGRAALARLWGWDCGPLPNLPLGGRDGRRWRTFGDGTAVPSPTFP